MSEDVLLVRQILKMLFEFLETDGCSLLQLLGVIQVDEVGISGLLHQLIQRIGVYFVGREDVIRIPGLLLENDRSPLPLEPGHPHVVFLLVLLEHGLSKILGQFLGNLLRHQPVVPRKFLRRHLVSRLFAQKLLQLPLNHLLGVIAHCIRTQWYFAGH